ncbi:Serine protease [Rhyzopertha dominica]|nr:Serine protease [Rhyzopertha dominica]
MKVFVCILAVLALTQAAERDLSKVVPRHINPPLLEEIYKYYINQGRITGGVEANPNQFPYQVALLLYASAGTFFCGGTLISENYVLTAAHCVDGVNNAEVVLGAHNIRNDEATQQTIPSNEFIIHSGWNPSTLVNDIALIKLSVPAQLNQYVQTINLPSYGDASNTFAGRLGTASGWGRPSDAATTISDVLRYIETNIITNLLCNISFLGMIQGSHICISGADGRSTCNGDSGGPLVVDNIQVGITSFGIALGCEVGWPAVFTRVTSFLNWIEQNSDVVIV